MTIFLYQFVMTCFSTRCIALIVASTNCSTTLRLWSRVLLVKLINSGATQEIPYFLWNMKICYHFLIFIIAPCILISSKSFIYQQMHFISVLENI